MAQMIQCDRCKKLMHADCRDLENTYVYIEIRYNDGTCSSLQLCLDCNKKFQSFLKGFEE